jgi:hypothetical protein
MMAFRVPKGALFEIQTVRFTEETLEVHPVTGEVRPTTRQPCRATGPTLGEALVELATPCGPVETKVQGSQKLRIEEPGVYLYGTVVLLGRNAQLVAGSRHEPNNILLDTAREQYPAVFATLRPINFASRQTATTKD